MVESPAANRPRADDKFASILGRLIDFYGLGADADRFVQAFDAITRDWRGMGLERLDPSFSAINGNGIPLQYSVSLGGRPRCLRLLSEVGVPGTSMVERLRLSSYRLRELVALLNLQGAVPDVNRVFAELFPHDPQLVEHWTGGIGMALAAAAGYGIRLRLYLNQRWGGLGERYRRISRVLALLGRRHSLAEWIRLADVVSAAAVPFGVSVDMLNAGVGRFKIYFAMDEINSDYLRSLLSRLGLAHRTSVVDGFIERFEVSRRHPRPWCLLPSLEFPEETEEPVGFKLDVSFNHLQTSDAWLDEAITDFVTGLSIDLMEYRSVLAALTEDSLSRDAVQLLQYGGLGFDDQANVRFNVYLAPASLLRPG